MSSFSDAASAGYYRERVNEGEAAMREHSSDRMWHGTKYRTQEEQWERKYRALNAIAQSAEQVWLGAVRAGLLPATAEGICACKCRQCNDTGVASTGREWRVCVQCKAYDLHAERIAAAAAGDLP